MGADALLRGNVFVYVENLCFITCRAGSLLKDFHLILLKYFI